MDCESYFLRNLFIFVVLFSCFVVLKAFLWLVIKLCAFICRGIKLIKGNTVAVQHADYVVTVHCGGNFAEPVSSENDESRRSKTTSLNQRNKKSYKEKESVLASEAKENGRIPTLSTVKQPYGEGLVSSIYNFNRKNKVVRRSTRPLGQTYLDVENHKGTNCEQKRNSGAIENPLIMKSQQVKEYILRKDIFHNVEKGAGSWNWTPWRVYSGVTPKKKVNNCNQRRSNGSINKNLKMQPPPVEELTSRNVSFHKNEEAASSLNATAASWHLYSDVKNERVTRCKQAQNNGKMADHTLRNDIFVKTEKVDVCASSTHCPERLWSVYSTEETTSLASCNEQQNNCANNENRAPESAAEDMNDMEEEPAESEINPRSSKFSCILKAVADAMSQVVMSVVHPLCEYVKSEWELFNDIYGENTDAARNMDPEVIACIKGEDRIHYHRYCPDNWTFCVAAPPCHSDDITTEQGNNEDVERNNPLQESNRNTTSWSKVRTWCGHLKDAIKTLYGHLAITMTAVKSELVAIVSSVHSVLCQLRANKQISTSQEITRCSFDVSEKNKEHETESPFKTEADQSRNAEASLVNTESTLRPSNQGCRSQFPDALSKAPSKDDNSPVPQNSGADIYPQMKTPSRDKPRRQEPRSRKEKAPPTVGHGEKQLKLSTKGKVKKEVAPSALPCKVDEPTSFSVGKEKKQKKVNTPTRVDLPAGTTHKTKEKTMPGLIPPSYVKVVARAKAHKQEMRSPSLGMSNLVVPATDNKESQECISHHNDKKPSPEAQNGIEHTVSRAKCRYKRELTFFGLQASKTFNSHCWLNAVQRAPTEPMQNPLEIATMTATAMARPRAYIKRRAEGNTNSESKYKPILQGSAMRTTQVATQMSDKGTMEQVELMEAGESEDLPFLRHPEAMNSEPGKGTVSFEETRPAYYEFQASVIPNVVAQVEPMETNAELETTAERETEEMETAQEQVLSGKFFPFSLPSFLTMPLATPPVEEEMEIAQEQDPSWNFFPCSLPSFLAAKSDEEEMEVVEQSVPAIPFNPEPKKMDISQHQHTFAIATSFRQPIDATWPAVATGIERPVTACTMPQRETMKIGFQHVDACRPVVSPFGELTDTKRPLASTVGMIGEADKPEKILPTKQPVLQLMAQQVLQHPVQTVSLNSGFQDLQSVRQQPVAQTIQQTTKEVMLTCAPVPPSQHPLINLSGMESKRTEEASITSTVSVQEATSKSSNQLTMEQLQLLPTIDPSCYYTDDSDSESDYDSDDEYELDFGTIEKFSELESSPEHAQLITKLLVEKESTQWHNDADSESDDDNYGVKYELSELLHSETNEKFSELKDILEISLEHVERTAKLLAEKESSCQQYHM